MRPISDFKQFVGLLPLMTIFISVLSIYNLIHVFSAVIPLRMCFILCSLIAVFLTPEWKRKSRIWKVLDPFFLISFCLAALYVIMEANRIADRIAYVDDLTLLDKVFGVIVLSGLIEATFRVCGKGLALVVLAFIAYAFWGTRFLGAFSHSGLSFTDFIDLQWMTSGGAFGIPVAVVSSMVIYFLLFSAFFNQFGGGTLFSDLAIRLTGRVRGGAAKCSVVASAAMGTVSGSAVANVVADGVFTINLMKKTGFESAWAGAIEAAASTGGQIMPPVMGAVAFVMAETTGIPYGKIALCAALPAILYYVALFIMVDFKAKQLGIRALRKEEYPPFIDTLRRIHLLLPIGVLIYGIVTQYSLQTSATAATAGILLVGLVRKETRFNLFDFIKALEAAGKDCVQVLIPCAAAGVLIGVVMQTGMGVKLTSAILQLAMGNTFLALICVMIACFILGMGMTTVAAYVIVCILMVPALIKMGIPLLPAHMFALYFAVLSMVTPPVALAAYAAAGIAKASVTKTGWVAFLLCCSGFMIPFVFVYNPALVLQGTPIETLRVFVGACIGIYALSGAIMGTYLYSLSLWLRLLGGLGGLLLIEPGAITDIMGILIFGSIFTAQIVKARRLKKLEGHGMEGAMAKSLSTD